LKDSDFGKVRPGGVGKPRLDAELNDVVICFAGRDAAAVDVDTALQAPGVGLSEQRRRRQKKCCEKKKGAG
jgi:hypothetical protein